MRVHFIGIGGIGLSALARFLQYRGYEVSGSDIKETPITKELQNEHVLFLVEKFGHKKSGKKLYLIDFAFRSVLSFEKDL